MSAREAVLVADVVSDLCGAALGASDRLPRRPGGSGGRAPAADEDQQRTDACAGDDREQDVERCEPIAVGDTPRTLGARLTWSDGGTDPVPLHRLRFGGSLVHHIVGHDGLRARHGDHVVADAAPRP